MQTIHPVAADETLIDQGCYCYYRIIANQRQKMPIVEPWSRHRNSSGDIITRAEREAHSFGNHILVHSLERNGVMVRFDVTMRNLVEHNESEVTARYQLFDDSVNVARTAADSAVTEQVEVLQPGFIPSPLMRIYTGTVIQRLVAQGESQVLVPWIRDPNNLEQLLKPLTSQRRAVFQAEETVDSNGGAVTARRYEYFGGEYQPGTLFWLDNNDVLLRYLWQQDDQTCWDTRLEQYCLAPGH